MNILDNIVGFKFLPSDSILQYFLMKVYSPVFFAFILFINCATVTDQLTSIQTSVVTVAPTSGSNNLVLGSNSYPITFANVFTGAPSVVAALCQFSSPMTTKYAVKLSTSSTTTAGFTLGIIAGSNWNYLSYSIFASIVDSVLIGNYQFAFLGLKQNDIATIKNQTIRSPLSNMFQTSFKLDMFIMGFDLTVSDASSKFFLNASLNYGSNDKMSSNYSKYNDYIYTVSSNVYPADIVISTTQLSLSLNWFGNLAALQLTYISHPFIVSPIAQYPLTGGYNTVQVTSSKYSFPLLDPYFNKNNLGSLNPASLYGFTSMNLKPISTVDANITILYSYFTNVTSSGSAINSLSASYFFYQKFENSIVDNKFTQVINSEFPQSSLGTLYNASVYTNSYYKYSVNAGTLASAIKLSSDIPVQKGSHYLMTFEILDRQGCYTGSDFIVDTFTMGFTNYDSQKITTTNHDAFFVSPIQICPGYIKSQDANEQLYRYFQLQITASKSQNIQGFFNLYDKVNTFYLKNIKFYQLSPNAILDPMITEVTKNSFFYYYKVTPGGLKWFFNERPFVSISNALMLYPFLNNPVTVTSIPLGFTIGRKYTLSFYILDTAGNLSSSFMSPILQIKIGGTTISTQKATLDKPFCSSAFNSTTTLKNPVDQFYLHIILQYIATSSSSDLQFILSDLSNQRHTYAIKLISIKNIEYFDPVTRNNVQSCPKNTYLTTNTLPIACQPCYVQNKIDNGSQCVCPSNTFQNQFAVCIQCNYSCYNCSSINKCTSCPTGRIFDATLFTCNCTTTGFYDDGMNSSCAACHYSCQNCSKKATNCTSCIQGRTLDTSTFMCNCPASLFDDSVNASCSKCDYSCQNCVQNANKCTNCISGRILDTNTSMCNCPIGSFDDGSHKQCVKCNSLCVTCVSKANQCTSCPSDRLLNTDSSICECKRGSYDNGMVVVCQTCDPTCGSCSGNAYNCTSCPIESVLDTTTSACICGAGYFNDTTPRCGKCSNKCGNCSENANKCTSCPIGSTLDKTTSKCICGAGYFNDTILCAKCNNPCGNCSENANKCTSCSNQSRGILDPATQTCKCLNGYSFSISGICTKNNPISIPNFRAQQLDTIFKFMIKLTPINNKQLNATDILKYILCSLYWGYSRRKLDFLNLKIIQIIILPGNMVQFSVQNPPFDVSNAKMIMDINNPNIAETSIELPLPQLYSSQTMSSISSSTSSSVASTVLLTILLFIMLIFYVLGYKHNHTISFIQKISFLRFNLPITASTFAFLYSLKYSYYAYGVNALQSLLSQNYLQNSNGNFYFVDQDANILRNVGIPILLSIIIILLRLIGLLLFKSSQQTTSSKKYYYRTIEYVQKTIMFPIIFFGIAEMTFANMYNKADTADPSIYNPSLAFSVIYVIYFAILTVATGFSKQISNYAKLELVGEYVFSIFDSIIIIQTYYTNNVLALIITIIIKCAYELFLKYTYAIIAKLDIMKVIVTVFQIALIGILVNSSTSLATIQALFVIVVVIDLLYVLGTIILKAMDKKRKQQEVPGEMRESNKEIVIPTITDESNKQIVIPKSIE